MSTVTASEREREFLFLNISVVDKVNNVRITADIKAVLLLK